MSPTNSMFPGAFLAIGGVGLAIFIFCILPIVLGVMALRQIDRSGGAVRGRGLALLAILLGSMSLLIVPILLFFGFLAAGRSGSSATYGTSTISPPAVYMTVTPSTPPAAPSIITLSGPGGTGGMNASGGNGANGGMISVTAPPVIPPPPSNGARTQANTQRSATTGSVGEQNPDEFGGVERPDPPKTNASTNSNPAPKKTSGSVGEQGLDD